MSELWSRARVSIAEYFSSAADAEEFAKDKVSRVNLWVSGLVPHPW